MQVHCRGPADIVDARDLQIAALHGAHARSVEQAVAHRAVAQSSTVEDACSFAWMQLLTHTPVDLGPPPWRALAWLTRTALREAWRLEKERAH